MTDRATLENLANLFAQILEDVGLGGKVGFAVLVFDFHGGGNLGWVSNAQRGDMIKALQEFIDKNGGASVFAH